MRMKAKFIAIAGALVISAVGIAHAADKDSTKVPGATGEASVDKNLAKHPNNKGLKNADRRHEEAAADRAARDGKVDRADKADRPDRPDRPQRPGKS